eukprot:TRINITY_DN5513_c0_g1_i2.p1 TRINITY_DN5513_c0_g1~~TRINITY_DN5513_c0_g1_i2.p1  ORF type:complete len:108 (+),score=22.70 TRINITY_DN5513_c0_g1_i2:80-403(+)
MACENPEVDFAAACSWNYVPVDVNQKTEKFFIIVNHVFAEKWIKDPESVRFIAVAQSDDIYIRETSANPRRTATKTELERAFNTTVTDEIVKFILKNGKMSHKPYKP